MTWQLLQKYLSGECSPRERDKVEAWIRADEENKKFMKSLERIWEVEPRDGITVDAESAWASFQHKLSEKEKKSSENIFRLHTNYSNRSFGWTKVATFAAAAVVLIAFLFYVYIPQFDTSPEAANHQPKMEQISTKRGQRTVLRLGDGSKVYLNAASSIKIPAEFGDSTRDVYLKGEAFFEVTHNPEKPFLVHTPNAYTKVLGTKFDVKAYPDEDPVRVVVKEGRVALGSTANPDTTHNKITRNHMGTLSRQGEMQITEVKIDKYLSWKDGRLIFKSTPLREVIPQLERWYDIDIEVADSSLYSQQMTASFKDEPMSEVLKIIALSLDASYERKDRTIIFRSNQTRNSNDK